MERQLHFVFSSTLRFYTPNYYLDPVRVLFAHRTKRACNSNGAMDQVVQQTAILNTHAEGNKCKSNKQTRRNSTNTNLPRILLTQPCETRSCLLISHGRTPLCESSTILRRMGSGSGLPLTKTPPSWFTPPCPLDPFPIGSVSEWSCIQKPGCGERARGMSFLWFHTVTYECYKLVEVAESR